MTVDRANYLASNPLALGYFLGYNKLTKLHLKWILDAWTNSTSEGIQAARGTYKSTSVIILGTIWHMLLYPQKSIFIVRKTFTNATSFIKEIRLKIARQEVQELFTVYQGEKFSLREESNSRILLGNKKNIANANVEAYGVTDSKTGAHADVILCDDIITLEDRIYKASRIQTKEALNELINISKEDSKFIFSGTVWDKNDAWGWIENHIKQHGGKLRKYPASKIWTQLFSAESLEERKNTIDPYLYAVNYELTFIDDSSLLFQNANYGFFDPETWRTKTVSMHLDAAFGGQDTTAFSMMSDNHVYGKAYRKHVKECYDEVVLLYKKYHCSYILVETNADKGFVAKELRALGLNVIEYHEKENKQIKIQTYIYSVWKDLIFDKECNDEFMEQLLFNDGSAKGHDDAPDSLASHIRHRSKGKKPSGEAKKKLLVSI